MWSDLSEPWKAAFKQAWEAYCKGSIPIGAVLADEFGTVIAKGRSMQYEKEGSQGQIVWSKLSHAEMNTLLQVSAHDHPNIRGCTLYTTVEPCPLCFGALVMSQVRNLRFAARDGWAGSANLLHANEFISSKPITVSGPFEEPEVVSTALNTEYFLRRSGTQCSPIIDKWEKDCPIGVRLGSQWFESGRLDEARKERLLFDQVYDELLNEQ